MPSVTPRPIPLDRPGPAADDPTAGWGGGPDARAAAIARVVFEVATALSSGLSVDVGRVVADHPDLMPELGEELEVQAMTHRASAAALEAAAAAGPGDADWGMVRPGDSSDPGLVATAATGIDPIGFVAGYRVTGPARKGGQATVHRAIHLATGRPVALKVLAGGASPGHRRLVRVDREVAILALLCHPNIVNVIDRGRTADGSHHLVMNYVDGPELGTWVAGRPVDDVLRAFAVLCGAAGEAHARRVVHRDLKPANVRVDARGEPHLLDFGLARRLDDPADADDATAADELVTKEGHVVGSLPWLSPEQAAGTNAEVDARSDVYALGVMLHEALTGRPAHGRGGTLAERLARIQHETPDPPSRLRPGVPASADAVVMKALSKRPADRYPDAAAMAADLRACLDGRPVAAPAYRRPRRVPPVVVAASAAAAAVVLALASVVGFGGRTRAAAPPGPGVAAAAGATGATNVTTAAVPRPTTDRVAAPGTLPAAGTATFRPTKDAFVRGGELYANTRFGLRTADADPAYKQLQVKTYAGTDRFNRDAYLEFDTSPLPAGCTVRSARLRLFGTASPGNTLDRTGRYEMRIGAFPLKEPGRTWLGNAITWTNRPYLTGWDNLKTSKGWAVVETGTPRWHEFVLTEFVGDERAVGRRSFTVGLHAPQSADLLAQFASAETANSPVLMVDYGP